MQLIRENKKIQKFHRWNEIDHWKSYASDFDYWMAVANEKKNAGKKMLYKRNVFSCTTLERAPYGHASPTGRTLTIT